MNSNAKEKFGCKEIECETLFDPLCILLIIYDNNKKKYYNFANYQSVFYVYLTSPIY